MRKYWICHVPVSATPDCTFLLFTFIDDAGDSGLSSSFDCDCTITMDVVVVTVGGGGGVVAVTVVIVVAVFEGDVVGSTKSLRDEAPLRCFDL